jgi:hypothetical protein
VPGLRWLALACVGLRIGAQRHVWARPTHSHPPLHPPSRPQHTPTWHCAEGGAAAAQPPLLALSALVSDTRIVEALQRSSPQACQCLEALLSNAQIKQALGLTWPLVSLLIHNNYDAVREQDALSRRAQELQAERDQAIRGQAGVGAQLEALKNDKKELLDRLIAATEKQAKTQTQLDCAEEVKTAACKSFAAEQQKTQELEEQLQGARLQLAVAQAQLEAAERGAAARAQPMDATQEGQTAERQRQPDAVQLEAARREHAEELLAAEQRAAKQLEAAGREHAEELQAAEQRAAEQLEAALREHAEELQAAEQRAAEQLEAARREHAEELRRLSAQHDGELQQAVDRAEADR